MLPSIKQLRKVTDQLQALMRIQDWDIEIKYCTDLEMKALLPGVESLGLTQTQPENKTAYICINAEAPEIQTEWFRVIVHELHHVKDSEVREYVGHVFNFIDEKIREPLFNIYQERHEQFIEQLTKTFVELYGVDDMGKNEKEKQIEEYAEYDRKDDSKKNKRNKKKK